MPTIDIGRGEPFLIERCEKCLGLFFDPGELDRIVATDVKSGKVADRKRLQQIVEEETPIDDIDEVRYIPCPDCKKLMNRTNFGARSGVILDRCKVHGVWLDGGELRRILHWLHAGGEVHQAQLADEQRRLKMQRENFDRHLEKIESRRREPERNVSHGGFDVVDVLMGLFD
jgi:Zn-finger nucleic acid-binding protein